MSNNDFEKRLQRQAFQKIPAGWRAEILRAAAEPPRVSENRASGSPLGLLSTLWRELVWRSRLAWGAVAAAWVVIVAVNLHDTSSTELARHDFTPPSPAVLMALREPERWVAEFTGPHEIRDADRPKKSVPLPRSEWRDNFFHA